MTTGHDIRPSHARRKARRYAVQALYQWLLTGDDIAAIEGQFVADYTPKADEAEYLHELLRETVGRRDELDALLSPALEMSMAEVDPVEQAILRISAYELLVRLEMPFKTVINEAVDLARAFGAAESHKFVNGVLDNTARRTRGAEVRADG